MVAWLLLSTGAASSEPGGTGVFGLQQQVLIERRVCASLVTCGC